MENLIYFGVGFLGYLIMRTITGVKITYVLQDIIRVLTKRTIESSDRFRTRTEYEFSRMSLDQKRKSKKYAYYCFINEVLAAFNLKTKGINVEGFTLVIFSAAIVVSIVAAILTGTILLAVFLPLLLIPVIIAAIFLMSRMKVRKRKQELLDSMDILCSVMSDGFLKAVKESVDQFPDMVQPYFKSFIKNVELLSISVPQAVEMLNVDVGSLYDEFCSSVIVYEQNRAKGMETLFNFFISENAKTQERDRAIKRMSDAVNIDYFASIGVIAGFGVWMSISINGGAGLWGTGFGVVVLIALILAAIGIFIYIQYLLSKAYIYTEKE